MSTDTYFPFDSFLSPLKFRSQIYGRVDEEGLTGLRHLAMAYLLSAFKSEANISLGFRLQKILKESSKYMVSNSLQYATR